MLRINSFAAEARPEVESVTKFVLVSDSKNTGDHIYRLHREAANIGNTPLAACARYFLLPRRLFLETPAVRPTFTATSHCHRRQTPVGLRVDTTFSDGTTTSVTVRLCLLSTYSLPRSFSGGRLLRHGRRVKPRLCDGRCSS
jgi:hypothetical protein